MPFLDRYWWLRLLSGIAMMITTAGVAGMTLWQSLIHVSDLWGDEPARLIAQSNLMMIGLSILLFVQSISVVRSAAQAHDRYDRRLAALRGYPDVIPIAGIPLHPANAPDVAVTPLVMQWAASRATRLIIAPLVIFLCVLFLAWPFFVAGTASYAIHNGNFTSPRLDPLSTVGAMSMLLLSVFVSFVVAIFLARDLPMEFGRPFGLSANSQGILSIGQHGEQRFLRWEEMRLLEVMTNDTRTSRTFRVYGSLVAVEWFITAAGYGYPPLGITASEMEERSQSLLDLINARTGLAPRTFDRPSRQLSGKANTVAAIGCMAVLALATIGFVAGLIFVPVTTSRMLNLTLAATVIYILAVVAGAVVMSAVRKPTSSEQSDSPEQLPDEVSVSYMLVIGSAVKNLLFSALSGIIMCIDLIPAALWLVAAVPLPFGGSYPHIAGIFGSIASVILLLIGLIGLLILIGALRSRVRSVTADANGITARRGRKTTFIAWNQVERVEGQAFGGTITTYTVRGAFVRITWPAVKARPPRRSDGAGVLPISPHGLAHLVAARTGKVLSISKRDYGQGDYHDAVS